MFEQLNDQLVQLKGDMKKKTLWEKQLAHYKKELSEIEETITELEKRLSDEQSDVQKLENFSLTNLFVTFLGKKEDRLDKEKQEVITVQLKLEAAMNSRKDIFQSINEWQTKLDKVMDVNRDYEQLLLTKEKLIKDSQTLYSRELYELSDQEADLQAYLSELSEAVTAGNQVMGILDQVIESLEKAKGWGTFDMLGGGMLSSAIKHDHLNQAKESIHRVQSKMRRFQKELLDIDETSETITIDISDMLKFADFFFDGLISDWMVQGKINHSLEQAEVQHEKINRILQGLRQQQAEYQTLLSQVKTKRKDLIEKL